MRQRLASNIGIGLTLATWGLLVFGASVRVHGAGLACPDWPLCFGQVIPPIDFQVGLEFGHRVLAGLISLGFAGWGALLFAPQPKDSSFVVSRTTKSLWVFAAVLLVVQVILGGLTVWELLAEWTVTSHLLAGNSFCLLLLLTTLSLRPVDEPAPVGQAVRALAVLVGVLVPLQLALGGWVASSYAGLACTTFPLCNGDVLIPTLEGLVGLHVIHRLVAYTLVLVAAALAVVAGGQGRVGRLAGGLFAVILVQAGIGVANVLLYLPVEVTLLHSFGAASTVLATGWLHFEVWRSPLPVEAAGLAASAPQTALEGA